MDHSIRQNDRINGNLMFVSPLSVFPSLFMSSFIMLSSIKQLNETIKCLTRILSHWLPLRVADISFGNYLCLIHVFLLVHILGGVFFCSDN